MLSKLFDCHLDDGHPVVRVHVDVPETAQEALEMAAPGRIDVLAESLPANPSDQQKAALEHERTRVEVLTKLLIAGKTEWQRENASRLEDDPQSQPATFEAAFPQVFLQSHFADRFAKADAKAEYFRLYGVVSSCAPFTAVEVQDGAPTPDAEHKNWTKIRKQIKTVGTDRKPGARAALLSSLAGSMQPKETAAAAPAKKP